MTKRIIYPNQEMGGICLMTPFLECGLTIEEIAKKDVPAGVPYRIIDISNVPTDSVFFNAWEADFSNPDGYGIGP